jgi:N,N'-diacetyllegionaminate synthase
MHGIAIGNKKIGEGEPCFIIAEAGSNHNGSMEQARRLIDCAADSGADAIKFQSFKAGKLFNEVKNKNVVDVLEKIELREDWYKELIGHSLKKGIMFLSSAFDEGSADLLDRLGVPAHKIASYELVHIPLLEHVAKLNKPMIISTGMANENEVKNAVDCVNEAGNDQVVLLHCVSQYPARSENLNLRSIATLKKKYDCPAGFSDHNDTIYASIAAVALGANVIEKHITISRLLPGPDHHYALEPAAFKEMVNGIREVEKMPGNEQIMPAKCEISERRWRRAVYAARDIPAGSTIVKDMLMVVRPAPEGSLAPEHFKYVLGKKIKYRVEKGSFLTKDMVCP